VWGLWRSVIIQGPKTVMEVVEEIESKYGIVVECLMDEIRGDLLCGGWVL